MAVVYCNIVFIKNHEARICIKFIHSPIIGLQTNTKIQKGGEIYIKKKKA